VIILLLIENNNHRLGTATQLGPLERPDR